MKYLRNRNIVLSLVIVFISTSFISTGNLSEALASQNVVRSYQEFKEYVKNSILAGRSNVDIVVENYNSQEYSLGRVIDELGKSVPETSFVFAGASNGSIRGNSGSAQRRVTYDLSFREDEHFTKLENLDRVNSKEGLKSVIKKDLLEFKTSTYVRIDGYRNNQYSFGDVIQDLLFENPNIGTGYSGVTSTIYGKGSDVVVRLNYRFRFSADEMKRMQRESRLKANEIIEKLIEPNMKDYERLLVIHDYIVNNATYDYDNYLADSIPPVSRTMYGVLINGVAVCEGYAKALKYLLDKASVENLIIVGTARTDLHAWNMVKIQGDYYHVDVTWNDPVSASGQNILRHDYFNLTDNQIAKTHTWDRSKYPVATTNKFNYENVKNAIKIDRENRNSMNFESEKNMAEEEIKIAEEEISKDLNEGNGVDEVESLEVLDGRSDISDRTSDNRINLSEDSFISNQDDSVGVLIEDLELHDGNFDSPRVKDQENNQLIQNDTYKTGNDESKQNESSVIRLRIGSRAYLKDGNPDIIDKKASVVPYIRDGRTMLPIRFLIETLGGNLSWDSDNSNITLRKNGKKISFKPGETNAVIDGINKEMQIPSEIMHDRTFVPLRFVSENLGVEVSWEPQLQEIYLIMN